MNIDDFAKRSPLYIKELHASAYNKSALNKHDIGGCRKNLGEFFLNAPCCLNTNLPADDCCCTTKKDVCFTTCDIVKNECIDTCPRCEGGLLILHVNLKNICLNKIIVVGVLLYENKKLYALKVKKITTGCSSYGKYGDFDAGEFCFVFPEDQLCQRRKFEVRVISNYVKF